MSRQRIRRSPASPGVSQLSAAETASGSKGSDIAGIGQNDIEVLGKLVALPGLNRA